jgi:hypothetical protein
MIINYRYYVISLISIFLALGIGIVIGFMMDGDQMFVSQQEAIISELEGRFSELKEEKVSLQLSLEEYLRDNNMYDEFSKLAYSEMVPGRLQGLSIAIIQTTEEFIFSSINKILTDSGADVSSITYIKKDFLQDIIHTDSDFYKELSSLIKLEGKDDYERVSHELARSIALGDNTDFVDLLINYGYIEVYGKIVSEVDYIIMVGGSSDNPSERVKKIDIPMIRTIKQLSIPVLGVEKSNIEHSYMRQYKTERISTVDNIDTILGQISAIMVIGGKPGNYGLKNDAEAFMPDGFRR